MNLRNDRHPRQDLLNKIIQVAWALFLVTLPVTSFPFFPPDLGGGTLVRPLAVYPLMVLLLLVTLPRLLRDPLPRTLMSFLPFVLVVLAGVVLALLQAIQPAQGVSVAARMLRALVTLGFGGAVYITVVLMHRKPEDLSITLRWLYLGFAVALLWGSLQAIYIIYYSPAYFELLSKIQEFISIRRLFTTRVSGLTYEPNWFAEQISFLLMPWLFAAVLRRRSVFKWRWRWLTFESLLLIWAGAVLVFTFSRTGLFILLVLVFLSVVLFRDRSSVKVGSARSKGLILRMVMAGVVVLVLASVIFAAGTQNNYFSRLWRYWTEDSQTSSYLEYIAVGQRLIYWQTAYSIFAENPLLGVGLGNFAFYFEDHLPERPFNTVPEILRIVTHSQGANRLITAKNLYARLLAETGLFGSAAFFAFAAALFGCALYLWFSPHPEHKYWGAAGLLALTVFLLTAISTDSFTIPNMWVVFGLVTAAAHTYAH